MKTRVPLGSGRDTTISSTGTSSPAARTTGTVMRTQSRGSRPLTTCNVVPAMCAWW